MSVCKHLVVKLVVSLTLLNFNYPIVNTFLVILIILS
jgi:hypothetical protein